MHRPLKNFSNAMLIIINNRNPKGKLPSAAEKELQREMALRGL